MRHGINKLKLRFCTLIHCKRIAMKIKFADRRSKSIIKTAEPRVV